MCGIAGSINWGNNYSSFGFNLNMLYHRGPDAVCEVDSRELIQSENFPNNESFSFKLGHARLSIVDLSAGANQPMSSHDEAYWLVYNGEIYNHRELRTLLESRGRTFKTSHSDTEVLLIGLIEYGKEFLEKINGMFAFVFVDRKNQSILAARDRMGIKPLFFRTSRGQFEFASEIRALKCPKTINLQAIRQYFHFRQTPGPETFFEDIFKLEAGELLEWNGRDSVKKSLWWNPWPNGVERTHVCEEEFEELLKDSVRLRLQADVQVGSFLSGGLDSSLISAIAAQQQMISTFSFGFTEGLAGYKSELAHARLVSRHLGTKHHEVVATPLEYLETLERVFSILDEPISDTACAPLLMLSELAKANGITVMLGGEGADELFLGYRHWWDARSLYCIWQKTPKPLRPLLLYSSRPIFKKRKPKWNAWLERMANQQIPIWGGIDSSVLLQEEQIFSSDFLGATENPYTHVRRYMVEEMPDNSDFFQRLSSFDLRHRLPEQLLARIDRMSMAASVEARVPYLDHRIVEKSLHMQVAQLGSRTSQKEILKRVSRNYIPSSISDRPKDGFTVPLNHILTSKRGEHTMGHWSPVFNKEFLRNQRGTSWPLFAFNLWLSNM